MKLTLLTLCRMKSNFASNGVAALVLKMCICSTESHIPALVYECLCVNEIVCMGTINVDM